MRQITLYLAAYPGHKEAVAKSFVAHSPGEYQSYLSLIDLYEKELQKKGFVVRIEDRKISEDL